MSSGIRARSPTKSVFARRARPTPKHSRTSTLDASTTEPRSSLYALDLQSRAKCFTAALSTLVTRSTSTASASASSAARVPVVTRARWERDECDGREGAETRERRAVTTNVRRSGVRPRAGDIAGRGRARACGDGGERARGTWSSFVVRRYKSARAERVGR